MDNIEVPGSLQQEMRECSLETLQALKSTYQMKDDLAEVDATRFQAVTDELEQRGYPETWGEWMQRVKEQHRALKG